MLKTEVGRILVSARVVLSSFPRKFSRPEAKKPHLLAFQGFPWLHAG